MKKSFALSLLLVLLSCPLAAMERPNVILCMADDQGWEETGYNGHPILRTPTLDKMAASGLRLDRFYSAAPNCGPTRGSIMTGRHPNRFGLFGPNWAMRPEEISLGTIMKQAGYATGHFGKWHLGPVKAGAPNNPGNSGFDEWLSHDNFFEMDPVLVRNGAPPKKIMGESSEIVADAAIDFLNRSVDQEKPFFIVLWFGSPHGPYLPLETDRKSYADAVEDELAKRYSEITAMDRAIGKLRNTLRSRKVWEDTLFWYCSDNGVPKGVTYQPKLRGTKGTLHEGGVRVPAIIEWPARIPTPRVSSVPAVTTDILPTLCDLLELPLPKRTLDGLSLVPLIDGKMKRRGSPIAFWKYNSGTEKGGERWLDPAIQKGTTPTTRNPGIDFLNFKHPVAKTKDFGGEASVMNDRYKLILPKKGGPMLFDIVADRAELNNLAEPKADMVKAMTQQLHAWQKSVEISLTGADY
ncbi:MAG: arylsulfatase A-like enzyme [Limisphaerales bacterium]|jgi:arylsulfatase A-like enzyme